MSRRSADILWDRIGKAATREVTKLKHVDTVMIPVGSLEGTFDSRMQRCLGVVLSGPTIVFGHAIPTESRLHFRGLHVGIFEELHRVKLRLLRRAELPWTEIEVICATPIIIPQPEGASFVATRDAIVLIDSRGIATVIPSSWAPAPRLRPPQPQVPTATVHKDES